MSADKLRHKCFTLCCLFSFLLPPLPLRPTTVFLRYAGVRPDPTDARSKCVHFVSTPGGTICTTTTFDLRLGLGGTLHAHTEEV